MSVASIQAFVARVAGDAALRDKLHAAAGVDDIVAMAAEHGHAIDKTVLLREHAKALGSAKDHELAAINSWGDALLWSYRERLSCSCSVRPQIGSLEAVVGQELFCAAAGADAARLQH